MVEHENTDIPVKKPLIVATMYGVTTPCVMCAKEYLEQEGYEVIIFHASGTGGKMMESLINSGIVAVSYTHLDVYKRQQQRQKLSPLILFVVC